MGNEVRNWRDGVRLSMMQGESASEISQEEVEGYFRKDMFIVVQKTDSTTRLHGFES